MASKPVKETVNTPVGAAVTRMQPPVPKLLGPVEASVQAVFFKEQKQLAYIIHFNQNTILNNFCRLIRIIILPVGPSIVIEIGSAAFVVPGHAAGIGGH
jgi:hypothetical protein